MFYQASKAMNRITGLAFKYQRSHNLEGWSILALIDEDGPVANVLQSGCALAALS